MRLSITGFLLSILVLTGAHTGMAQEPIMPKKESTSFDFVPGKTVIFEDNFSQDHVGKFPSKWRLYPTYSTLDINDSITNTGVYPIMVEKEVDGYYLAIASDNHYFPLTPKINRLKYLTDTFTIEFDFRMDNEQSDPAIVFFDENGTNIFECRIIGSGEIISRLMRETPISIDYQDSFRYKSWHHFAVSFMHRQIKTYVDKYRILTLPDCQRTPDYFIIAGNSYTEGKPVVAFRKIRLATGIPPVNIFNQILTDNKVTTHAIHFQKGKSAIEPESMEFIQQLAEWLKANPAIRLEIDGYTDNDGEAKTNMVLSKDRAKAVKTALQALGVDDTRVATNGFGEERPIDTNDTPEGKAQNRRVEFIKL